MLKVKKLRANAKLPTRGTPGSAGLDLYCTEDVEILPGQKVKIPTGIAMVIPAGCYGSIEPRSSVGSMGTILLAKIVDNDYRLEVFVSMKNIGDDTVFLPAGSRVAQMIILHYEHLDVEEVEELGTTSRTGGYGSTGL